jgi:hypothetical protein
MNCISVDLGWLFAKLLAYDYLIVVDMKLLDCTFMTLDCILLD